MRRRGRVPRGATRFLKPICAGLYVVPMGCRLSQSFKKTPDLRFDAQLDGKLRGWRGVSGYFAASIATASEK